jgi:cytochrome c
MQPGCFMVRIVAALLLLALSGCGHREAAAEAAAVTGGNVERGRMAVRADGCGACHMVPGVRGARGKVGPPLGGIASRSYIAGVLPNSPENMVRWLIDPPGVNPLTAMPNLGLDPRRARDITAYLYTLR